MCVRRYFSVCVCGHVYISARVFSTFVLNAEKLFNVHVGGMAGACTHVYITVCMRLCVYVFNLLFLMRLLVKKLA